MGRRKDFLPKPASPVVQQPQAAPAAQAQAGNEREIFVIALDCDSNAGKFLLKFTLARNRGR
jgi:hypothetical protein